MTQNQRKFAGGLLLPLLLIVYAGLAVAVHLSLIVTLPMFIQMIYFAIAGLGWAVPAALLIRWMSRPDAH